MGQLFDLYNLDNSIDVENSVGGKFGEFFFDLMTKDDQLLRALWSPNEGEKRVVVLPLSEAEGYVFPQESSENLTKGLINQLANEVIAMILSEVYDILDLVSFMMACQRYWEIGRHHLERLIEESIVVSWAGDRLICLGAYAVLGDLPEGMLTDSEVEKIEAFYDNLGTEDLWEAIPTIQPPRRNVTSAAMKYMRSASSTSDLLFSLRFGGPGLTWLAHPCYTSSCGALQTLILITDLHPDDFFSGYMVFRNLVTKEFVRGDAIRKARDTPDKPWLKGMNFEHVLYIRTTWSSDPGIACMYDGPLQIHRGVWAGHRFDVKDIDDVVDEEGVVIDNWKDVTKEVINEVMEIWEPEGRLEFQ